MDSDREQSVSTDGGSRYRPIKNASASPIRTRHARSLCLAPANTRVMKFFPSTLGVQVAFIGRDEFIRNKRASGRNKDLGDIDALEG